MRPTPVHHAMLAALQCTRAHHGMAQRAACDDEWAKPQKRGGRVVITSMKQHPSKLDCGGAPHWQPADATAVVASTAVPRHICAMREQIAAVMRSLEKTRAHNTEYLCDFFYTWTCHNETFLGIPNPPLSLLLFQSIVRASFSLTFICAPPRRRPERIYPLVCASGKTVSDTLATRTSTRITHYSCGSAAQHSSNGDLLNHAPTVR